MNNTDFPKMHVSLYVSNVQKTVSFYESFFGQSATKVKAGYAKFHLDSPSLVISFVENKEQVSAHFGHLGFQVETEKDLAERLNAVSKIGFETLEEKGTNCCYAKQDKFWVQDPDGYRWEVYILTEDVEFNDPHYRTEAEACCSPEMVTEKEVKSESCCNPSTGCC